jgi:hypothetical protein
MLCKNACIYKKHYSENKKLNNMKNSTKTGEKSVALLNISLNEDL